MEMRGRVECEFALVRYVPDPIKGEFANIGVILRGPDGSKGTAVRFTRDWGRVRCLDPGVDLPLLESLEAEFPERLAEEARGDTGAAKPILDVLTDSLSNSVQLTEMSGTLAESLPAGMEALLRMYVEPQKTVTPRKRASTGRTAIAGRMRGQFEQAGVWALMRKRIPAKEYTGPGDSLKIDCGYRNGIVRLFHAVSLDNETDAAKSLAFSARGLQAGVERVEGTGLELTAVVEPIAAVSDPELYRFGVGLMEEVGLRVLTMADLGRVAETARRELRV